MNDSFAWWLVIAGVAIGVALAWLILGRLPRDDDDVSAAERAAEAAWISRNVAQYGGDAPEPLVEEILDLHRHYLEGPPTRIVADTSEDADLAWIVGGPAVEAEPGLEPEELTSHARPRVRQPIRIRAQPHDPE